MHCHRGLVAVLIVKEKHMDFLAGLVVGWLSTPYVLAGTLLFLSGFPIFFFGYDIYEGDRWHYRFWRTVAFIALTVGVLHFFTPFDISWLITGDFWGSVLRLWLFILGYIVVGIVFSYLRFFFYAREYGKRMNERLKRDPSEHSKDREFRNRLSGYGSRVSLILKWIFHWPWSLVAWILTDLVRNLFDAIFDGVRGVLGRGYGSIARMNEPAWMREREQQEKAAAEAAKSKA